MQPYFPHDKRAALRRQRRLPCRALQIRGVRPLGFEILDVSPDGLLVACVNPVDVGEDILVGFRSPGGLPIDGFARVARVVRGRRATDLCYAAGLSFVHLGRAEKAVLSRELRGTPPPIPARRPIPDLTDAAALIG